MAKRVQRAGASKRSVQSNLPFRRCVDRPTSIFIDNVLKELKEHAHPERIEVLYRNPISKDVTFFKLRDVELDGKKRTDHAPCPMCSSNRFLNGALVHIPSLQCCAVIGHCCATRDAQAAADREFRYRQKRDYEETYLLENLCFVPARLAVLQNMRPAAVEARRLYRQFRKEASKVQYQLRQVKRSGGELVLHEVIRGGEDDEETDYVGPAGIKGRGDMETRSHTFGRLEGAIATVKNYDPVKELDTVVRQLSSLDEIPDESELIDFITRITEKQRTAAVAIMTFTDNNSRKVFERLAEFLAFFSSTNAEQLNSYGTSQHNSAPFEVTHGLLKGRPAVAIKQRGAKCILHVGEPLVRLKFDWPGKK